METHPALRRLDAERRRLEAARTLLLADVAPVGTDLDGRDDHAGGHQHTADAASDTLELEVDRSILDAVERELLDIAAAEARIAAGTYGRCESCGRPISEERLRAIPWAARCLDDQAHAEVRDESLRADVLHGPAEVEALRNSDLIPDEEAVPDLDLSAEEAAMHPQP